MKNKELGLKSKCQFNTCAIALAILILACARSTSGQQLINNTATNTPPAQTVVLPPGLPDPIEPVNRVLWAVDRGLLADFVQPTARVYRSIVPKIVRTGLANMGTNITYPDRLVNNLIQGRWAGARDETYRFLGNSTVGVAGFFDVATKWKIPRSPADFGQTFSKWGWKPHCFIMIPLYGPSDERDLLGLVGDQACNPLLYVSPYNFQVEDPFTWAGPYSYFNYAVLYNDLSDTVDADVSFINSEMDPYAEIEYAWSFARANRVANFQIKGKKDEASLETLESVFFSYQDPEFPSRGKTRSVKIPATGRRLKFSFWLQPGKASIVYLVAGLGSHRMGETSLALAEVVFKHGFSVVNVSSPFNAEFMDNASTTALPAYLPIDGDDLRVALSQIDQRLNQTYPGRVGRKALMGYSMGAFESLYIAATERTNQRATIQFDRYLAVDTPVRLLHGVEKLDEFYRAPLAWIPLEREANLENTLLKVAALSQRKITPRTSLPFSAVESKFLIGLDFRFILRDIIYDSQRRHNMGVLRLPIKSLRRAPLYNEIMRYSYQDYFRDFAAPYYQKLGLASETLDTAGNLNTYSDGLRANPKVRVIVNQNDFLLTDEDLAWLHATFGPNDLTVFPKGGHLGNLANSGVQKAILKGLDGLKEPPPSH